MRREGIATGLLGFAITAAYWPWWSGGATTPRWAIMALAGCAVPFLPTPRVTWAHITGGAFVLWALISLAWSPTLDTHDWLLKLLILAGMFMLGASLTDMRPFWLGAAIGLLPSALMIAIEAAGLVDVLGIPRFGGFFKGHQFPDGLFGNGLFYAEAGALVAVALACQKRFVLAAIIVCSFFLLGSVPRGPFVAIAVAFTAWLIDRPNKPGLIACPFLVAGALIGASFLNPDTVMARVAMWRDVLDSWVPLGHGYGSYHALIPLYAHHYDASAHWEIGPHNEFLGVLFELGLPGFFMLIAFCAISIFGASRANENSLSLPANVPSSSAERLVLITFLAEALVGFNGHLAATAGMFGLCAGHVSRGLPCWRVSADRWRDCLFGRRERAGRTVVAR